MFQIQTGKRQSAQKIVLYGVEGIGKTTFAAKFPSPLFIDTEGGTSNFDLARLPDPTSWTMLLEEVRYVISSPSICKTLVIDSVDWVEKLAYRQLCESKKWDSIEQPGYGAGYRYAYEEMGKFLNLLTDVISKGVNVLLIAHAKMRKFEQPDEMGSYDRWEMKLQTSPQCNTASMVKEWADMVLFANYKTYVVATDDKGKKHKAQGGSRVIYTSHHPCWDAKNRHGLPNEIPMDYSAIAHCIPDGAATPAIAPTPVPEPQASLSGPVVPPAATEDVPSRVKSLMEASGIAEDELREVWSQKGYFPKDTRWEVLEAEGFVDGWILPNWERIVGEVNKKLPF